MQVKVTNVIRTPRRINGYSIYKIIIDKDIDTVVDDKLVKTNGFSITGYSIMKYNININNLINRTIDIDVILHKAGDNYVNMHGNANKFSSYFLSNSSSFFNSICFTPRFISILR